jgi:hypothetical protein
VLETSGGTANSGKLIRANKQGGAQHSCSSPGAVGGILIETHVFRRPQGGVLVLCPTSKQISVAVAGGPPKMDQIGMWVSSRPAEGPQILLEFLRVCHTTTAGNDEGRTKATK